MSVRTLSSFGLLQRMARPAILGVIDLGGDLQTQARLRPFRPRIPADAHCFAAFVPRLPLATWAN